MRTMRASSFVAIAFAGGVAAQDCDAILEMGAYNIYSSSYSAAGFSMQLNSLCKLYRENASRGQRGNLDIGFKMFSLGGGYSQADMKEILSRHYEESSNIVQYNSEIRNFVREVDTSAVQAWQECKNTRPGLMISLTGVQGSTKDFIVRVEYLTDAVPFVAHVRDVIIRNATCEGIYFLKSNEIAVNGANLQCMRQDSTLPAIITFNADSATRVSDQFRDQSGTLVLPPEEGALVKQITPLRPVPGDEAIGMDRVVDGNPTTGSAVKRQVRAGREPTNPKIAKDAVVPMRAWNRTSP